MHNNVKPVQHKLGNKMNKKIISLLALLFSLTFTQIAFADKDATNASCGCKNNIYKKLELTPEQQTQIKAIREQANIIKIAKQKEMLSVNNQIQELIKADKLDEAKLDSLLNQKKELMASMIKNKVIVKHQIYNIFTAPQKEKYNEMMKAWEQKRLQKLNNVQNAISQ